MSYTYTVVLERQPEGGYVVEVPSLPGCLTEGDTVDESLAMARDVIALFVETLRDLGKPVPPDDPHVALDMTATTEALVYRLTVDSEAVAVA